MPAGPRSSWRTAFKGVATFYTLFNKQPVGKHQVWVCRTLSCALNGADGLLHHCEKKLGVNAFVVGTYQVSGDMVRLAATLRDAQADRDLLTVSEASEVSRRSKSALPFIGFEVLVKKMRLLKFAPNFRECRPITRE